MARPNVGTMWIDRETKKTFRVVKSGDTILLMGDRGVLPVPEYLWPGDFVALDGSDSGSESEPIRALLVGGSEGRHFERIWDHSADLGVDIEYHWPGDIRSFPSGIPVDVDLVILLVSHMSHAAQKIAKSSAKSRGVPVVQAPSRGFQNSLRAELEKLGLDSYGAVVMSSGPHGEGVYVWNGSNYVYRSVGSSSSNDLVPVRVEVPAHSGNDVFTLASLGVFWALICFM